MINQHSILPKLAATLMSADENSVDGAMDTLIEMTGMDKNNLSLPESEVLLIAGHMAELMSGMLDIIARDKSMTKKDILHQIAYASME